MDKSHRKLDETLDDVVEDILKRWDAVVANSSLDVEDHEVMLAMYRHCAAVDIASLKMDIRMLADAAGIPVVRSDVRTWQEEEEEG